MKSKYIILFVMPILLGVRLSAQDYHFSQYEAASMYLNPALTGMYMGEKGDYKIANDFRTQWRSLGGKPFTTVYLGFDMPYEIKGKKFGFGAYLINDRAGSSNFNTLNFMVSGAYNIIQNSEKHYLTTGLQMGVFNKSFNPNGFTYDSQYSSNSGTFDSNLSNDENFSTVNILRFDANMGIFYKYTDKQAKVHPFAGFSIYHVTEPSESFSGKTVRLPMRFVGNVGCDIPVNDRISITPKILYMYQAAATEIYGGATMYYKLKDNFRVLFGLDYRNQDAFVAEIGFKQDEHIFRIGYDVNTSYLNNYTGGRGAFEISLVLTGFKGKPLIDTKSMF
jgi:type IX secretion system PorP/SprF family membrane protein